MIHGRFPKHTKLVFRIHVEPRYEDRRERGPTDGAQSSERGEQKMTDPDRDDASR